MAAIAWWPFPGLPLGSADRFLGDYAVCAIVLLNFACARDAGFTALLRIAPAVRMLASYTFTLYLSHAMVIGVWLAVYPHERTSNADLLALAAAIAARGHGRRRQIRCVILRHGFRRTIAVHLFPRAEAR